MGRRRSAEGQLLENERNRQTEAALTRIAFWMGGLPVHPFLSLAMAAALSHTC